MESHKTHLQTLASLLLLEGHEDAHLLLKFIHPSLGKPLEDIFNQWKNTPQAELPQILKQHLKALKAQESFSGIAEIHPAWLLEALKRESHRVIGVILRHLPSKHVRFLLEYLPRRTVMRLPKLIEAFYVQSEILNLVRKRFERHFVPMRISHQVAHFEFHHLYYLRMEELAFLIRELGLSELALSLVGSPKKMVQIVLNRLSVQDAKAILHRMKRFFGESKWLHQDAKYSILELGSEERGVENFLQELGLESLAKGFAPSDSFFFEVLKQKLSPDNAYLFKRYIEEEQLKFSPEKTQKRKDWVLDHVRNLSNQGRIDSIWKEALKKEAA